MALSTSISLRVQASLSNALDLGSAFNPLDFSISQAWDSGVAANQADKIFHDVRTLGASATENLDFAGVLTDPFGISFTLAKLKYILFYADPANNAANSVVVTRPAANGVTIFTAVSSGISLLPAAWFSIGSPSITGYPITGGTADLVTVTNSAGTNSVVYTVIAIGTSS